MIDWIPLRFAHGRLTLHEPIGTGGMASVHVGRLRAAGGERTVAVKRPHLHLTGDASFVAMLLDEARLTLRLRHPNIVETLEVVVEPSELLLVMEYVRGEALSSLRAAPGIAGVGMPPAIAAAIIKGAAEGLHAAHETRGDDGEALEIVHRDISPQNILVGADGRARVLDFGVAKAIGRLQATREGQLKGKLAYMAPEALDGRDVDRRADVFALTMVLWECLTGEPLVSAESGGAAIQKILYETFAAPSSRARAALPAELDAVVARGLCRSIDERYATAAELAEAVSAAIAPASEEEVACWVAATASEALAVKDALVRRAERDLGAEAAGHDDVTTTSTEVGRVARVRPSASTPELASPRSRSRTAAVLAASAIAVGAAAVGLVATARSSRPEPETEVAASVSASASTTSAGVTSPSVASSGTDPGAPPAAVTSARPATTGVARARPARASASAPRASCNPPHYVDSRGIQHFRPECLERK